MPRAVAIAVTAALPEAKQDRTARPSAAGCDEVRRLQQFSTSGQARVLRGVVGKSSTSSVDLASHLRPRRRPGSGPRPGSTPHLGCFSGRATLLRRRTPWSPRARRAIVPAGSTTGKEVIRCRVGLRSCWLSRRGSLRLWSNLQCPPDTPGRRPEPAPDAIRASDRARLGVLSAARGSATADLTRGRSTGRSGGLFPFRLHRAIGPRRAEASTRSRISGSSTAGFAPRRRTKCLLCSIPRA